MLLLVFLLVLLVLVVVETTSEEAETETTVSLDPRVKKRSFPTLKLRRPQLFSWWPLVVGNGSCMRTTIDFVAASDSNSSGFSSMQRTAWTTSSAEGRRLAEDGFPCWGWVVSSSCCCWSRGKGTLGVPKQKAYQPSSGICTTEPVSSVPPPLPPSAAASRTWHVGDLHQRRPCCCA